LRSFEKEIQELQNLPINLYTLKISFNRIKVLQNLPNNLYEIDISDNIIEFNAGLPNSIKILNLAMNRIKNFDNIPISIRVLNVFENNIRLIPYFLIHLNIREFHFNHNPIENSHVPFVQIILNKIDKRIRNRIQIRNNKTTYSNSQSVHHGKTMLTFLRTIENLLR
jgi:hypothetical protein